MTELTYPDKIEIIPCGSVRGEIRPPGSKSITNRAFICAALAAGESRLRGILDSEDTQVMIAALRQLGLRIELRNEATEAVIQGCVGKVPRGDFQLYVANSGTTVRFLTAMLAVGQGVYRLDGTERMRQRPIGDLIDTLAELGANIVCENENRCPPLAVYAAGIVGGRSKIRGDISSQYLSGILMAAPYARTMVELVVEGELVSIPYVQMTLDVMKSFGVTVARDDYKKFLIPNGIGYGGTVYDVEPDASAASYFFAAAAITGGEVTVLGLHRESLQGDVQFCECLRQMGCDVHYAADRITVRGPEQLHGVNVDMNAISDTSQTLAAVALFAAGPTTIRGVAHNRHKETDRIDDLATELRKLGAEVQTNDDGMCITPGKLRPAEIATYHDHRMAMSLALVGLRTPGVVIRGPGCVSKTYPRFFEDLEKLTASAR